MTLTTVSYPVAPTAIKRKGTLLDAVPVSGGIEWLDGIGLFDSYNCMTFGESAAFCGPNDKDFDQTAGWVDGFRFAVYGGVTCRAVGLDTARMQSEVRSAFEAGESTAVEAALMDHLFVANAEGSGLPGEWEAATDITPAGGAVKPAVGVALLEGHAARNYVGEAILHMPRSIASLLIGVDGAVFSGNVLNTKLGSRIAAGAGYDYPNSGPDGLAAADGEKWLYATGGLVLRAGEVDVRQAVAQEANDVVVLAERAYVVAVDCYKAAIRVTVEG